MVEAGAENARELINNFFPSPSCMCLKCFAFRFHSLDWFSSRKKLLSRACCRARELEKSKSSMQFNVVFIIFVISRSLKEKKCWTFPHTTQHGYRVSGPLLAPEGRLSIFLIQANEPRSEAEKMSKTFCLLYEIVIRDGFNFFCIFILIRLSRSNCCCAEFFDRYIFVSLRKSPVVAEPRNENWWHFNGLGDTLKVKLMGKGHRARLCRFFVTTRKLKNVIMDCEFQTVKTIINKNKNSKWNSKPSSSFFFHCKNKITRFHLKFKVAQKREIFDRKKTYVYTINLGKLILSVYILLVSIERRVTRHELSTKNVSDGKSDIEKTNSSWSCDRSRTKCVCRCRSTIDEWHWAVKTWRWKYKIISAALLPCSYKLITSLLAVNP